MIKKHLNDLKSFEQIWQIYHVLLNQRIFKKILIKERFFIKNYSFFTD